MPKRGNKQSKFQQRLKAFMAKGVKPTFEGEEGKFKVSFTFDGKTYEREHQLTAYEVSHMKRIAAEHGDLAADQIVWKMASKGIAMTAEGVIGQAGLEYVQQHFVPKIQAVLDSGVEERQSPPPNFKDTHSGEDDEASND